MDNELGKRLKALRNSKGYTQADVANKAKITRSTISNYEHGRRTPHLKDLQKLSKIYGVGLDYFGITPKDEVFNVLVRASQIFRNDEIPPEIKEELYREFMKMYIELKEGN